MRLTNAKGNRRASGLDLVTYELLRYALHRGVLYGPFDINHDKLFEYCHRLPYLLYGWK
jgi:hypothetical protein